MDEPFPAAEEVVRGAISDLAKAEWGISCLGLGGKSGLEAHSLPWAIILLFGMMNTCRDSPRCRDALVD